MLHGAYALASQAGLSIGLDLTRHARQAIYHRLELKCAFGAIMPSDSIIMTAPEHLCTAFASYRNVQLHVVVEETVMLLPIALLLAKQHG